MGTTSVPRENAFFPSRYAGMLRHWRRLFRLPRKSPWMSFVLSLIASSLCYGVGVILLFPYFDIGARGISFPFVWYWGWRYGARGGFVAGLLVDVILGNAVCAVVGLPGYQLASFPLHIILNCLIGTLAGVMSELSQRLQGELQHRALVEDRLKESEAGYRLLFDNNPHPMWVCDPQSEQFLAVNNAAVKHYGYSMDEFLSMRLEHIQLSIADGSSDEIAGSRSNLTKRADSQHVRKDGSILEVEVAAHFVAFRGRKCRLYLVTDISERKRAQAALEHQALHDALTGLPNRTLLGKHLDQAVAACRRTSGTFALLALDLDRFKEINDSLGHHCGDVVLNQVSERFRAALRDSDILARFGGDEFALLLPDSGPDGAIKTSRRLLAALEQPFALDGLPVSVGVSIGIAIYPHHGTCSQTLLQRADVAMYQAKKTRSDVIVYADDCDATSTKKLTLASELRQGIEDDQLLLHYQPQVDLRTKRIESAEALVRWPHPRDGMLSPSQFVPLAEHTGLIKSLSLWVMETALLQCRLWRRSGFNLDVAVNLSPSSFTDEHLVTTITRLLNNADALPSWLTIEITENVMMADPDATRVMLHKLRDLGVRISIDDFGTGQSSLAYLRDFPVDEIKIDKSFIKHLNSDPSVLTIVRSIIELGSDLNCRVVAEGIEDQATLDRLCELGCHAAQGYFVERPRPAHDFTNWLNAQSLERMHRANKQAATTSRKRAPQLDRA
jgi:diguanylate cyclase (GGDEF)-like protein/PAS domain S-box-containing protein